MSNRPRRKRRRPQRLCEELPDAWGAEIEDEDYPLSGPDSDSESECDGEYEDQYVDADTGMEEEEYEEEYEEEDLGGPTPPNLSPYFRHTKLPPRPRARKALAKSEPWWWDRLDVHVAYACAAGSFAVFSLVLGLLVVQTGAADEAYRLGTESTWARALSEYAMAAWRCGFGGEIGREAEAAESSWWPSGWGW